MSLSGFVRVSPLPLELPLAALLSPSVLERFGEALRSFAFLPFGGGARKCVGDQFAMMEATVALAMMLVT